MTFPNRAHRSSGTAARAVRSIKRNSWQVLSEFRRELLGLASEAAGVGADRDEQAPAFDPAPRVGFDPGEDSRRLAHFADAADGVVDDGHDLRIVRLARIAERRMEIRRADEYAVHAFHRGDFLEVVQALLVLDLNENAELLVGAFRVILHARKARRSRPAGDAAHACRRIARG